MIMNQFKRCSVVLLPTNQKIIKGDLLKRHIWKGTKNECNSLWKFNEEIVIDNIKQYTTLNSSFRDVISSFEPQCLYIISDEEIKEDDYSVGDEGVFGPYGKGDILPSNSKRIIATTDTSLGLPQPSQQFIEKYIKEYNLRNIIANVLVEYLEGHIDIHSQITPLDCKVDYFNEYGQYGGLKVNKKDNTITIKKVKDSWNREEVSHLLNIAMATASAYGEEMNQEIADEWINENL